MISFIRQKSSNLHYPDGFVQRTVYEKVRMGTIPNDFTFAGPNKIGFVPIHLSFRGYRYGNFSMLLPAVEFVLFLFRIAAIVLMWIECFSL
jgi:hypothetical protein